MQAMEEEKPGNDPESVAERKCVTTKGASCDDPDRAVGRERD
jgi:hypothetical protein